MKVALIRGAFLNQYEAQLYYPLLKTHEITGFCSRNPIHDDFPFEVRKLLSPIDIQFGPLNKFKMPILNRLFIDAHWLIGLENSLVGFDIAHCADTFYHFTHQSVVAKRQGKVKKVVATIFENIPFNNESILGRKKFKQDAIRNIDHFIAISERSKATLIIEGADEDKITVIGQRIDISTFSPAVKRNSNSTVKILFSGRLEFYKGIYEIIYAARKLLDDKQLKSYKLEFVFVGNGTQKMKMISLIEKLHLQEYVTIQSVEYEKMPAVYQTSDIFVAPSRATPTYQEQFSTVLLEAQASGLPIVTTYSGGIPENVEDAALMANPGDFYSIAESLKKLILNPNLRKYYGNRARKHVKKYSVEKGAKEIEKIYEMVLK